MKFKLVQGLSDDLMNDVVHFTGEVTSTDMLRLALTPQELKRFNSAADASPADALSALETLFRRYEEQRANGHVPHVFYTAADVGCNEALYRQVVEGGLAICKVCGGAEGSLTTSCCEKELSSTQQELVMSGLLDFQRGKWWLHV